MTMSDPFPPGHERARSRCVAGALGAADHLSLDASLLSLHRRAPPGAASPMWALGVPVRKYCVNTKTALVTRLNRVCLAEDTRNVVWATGFGAAAHRRRARAT